MHGHCSAQVVDDIAVLTQLRDRLTVSILRRQVYSFNPCYLLCLYYEQMGPIEDDR